MAYGGLGSPVALIGCHATYYRVFGPERVEALRAYEAICTALEADPEEGPDQLDDQQLAELEGTLTEVRRQGRGVARTKREKVIAGLVDATGYTDVNGLDESLRATVEYVRWSGRGAPDWSPESVPRLKVLELHDNQLDSVSLLSFDFRELTQLEVLTLHGNRLEELPPLPASAKLVTLVTDALVAPGVALRPPGSPAERTQSSAQLLLLAGAMQLLTALLMAAVAVVALVNTLGLCCPALLLPIPPLLCGLNDLRTGMTLSSGKPFRGAAANASLVMVLTIVDIFCLNIILFVVPMTLIPVVLEIVAHQRLTKREVAAYHRGKRLEEGEPDQVG